MWVWARCLHHLRLSTAPARKPRTECCCHSVAAIIAATVAPDDARSIVISRACLLSARPAVIDDRTFDCVSDLRTAVLLLGGRNIFVRADLGVGIGGPPSGQCGASRRTTSRPSQPHSLRGRTQGLRHRGERSTAPIEHEGQSFLSNNIAFCRNGHSYQRSNPTLSASI